MDMNIPLKAQVLCTDGSFGHMDCILLDPLTKQVSHIVVKDSHGGIKRMVPLRFLQDARADGIYLNCETGRARRCERFLIEEFIADDETISRQHVRPPKSKKEQLSAIHYEVTPPGELALRQGARVHALDGKLGTVSKLRAELPNGRLTHVIVRLGNIWEKHESAVASEHIQKIEETNIYLDLHKHDAGRSEQADKAGHGKDFAPR